MDAIKIEGGQLLSGTVVIQGSKNVFHKILGACVRWPGVFNLTGVPQIQDAAWLLEQFQFIGGIVTKGGGVTILDSRPISPLLINQGMAEKSSGTFLFAGALLARFGQVEIAPPGGDKIGFRPVGYHLEAFKAMGAVVEEEKNGQYLISANTLSAYWYKFAGRTVNGTVNAILAATAASGEVLLENCAVESDILDAINFMRQLGASIEITDNEAGIISVKPGTQTKPKLNYTLIADSNATATYAIAGALCGRSLVLENINSADTLPLWEFLEAVGTKVHMDQEARSVVISQGEFKPHPHTLTGYLPPKFSTDWAPMAQVLLTQLPGKSEYYETVFSNRFAHVPELCKMGARIWLHDKNLDQWVAGSEFSQDKSYDRSRYHGSTKLTGREVYANDIRNGAALVLAGLVADGLTTVRNAVHLQRGYEDIVNHMGSLGAEISWTD